MLLGPADARDPPTAALATLNFAGKWSELGNEGGQLVDYVKPKQLKGSV